MRYVLGACQFWRPDSGARWRSDLHWYGSYCACSCMWQDLDYAVFWNTPHFLHGHDVAPLLPYGRNQGFVGSADWLVSRSPPLINAPWAALAESRLRSSSSVWRILAILWWVKAIVADVPMPVTLLWQDWMRREISEPPSPRYILHG